MLLCSLEDVPVGSIVGAAVLHPHRPETELLAPGVALDAAMLKRLRELEVAELWIHHDALADMDAVVNAGLSETRREIYQRIRSDFSEMASQSITTTQVQQYRSVIMSLVCELVSSGEFAVLTDGLFSADHQLFSHCANVAYLATMAGLELQPYIVRERARLPYELARDVTNLGVAAMLHDIGKLDDSPTLQRRHEAWLGPDEPRFEQYRGHVIRGYQMLHATRTPASIAQAVLHHHQRYDGKGWPDLGPLTQNRRRGPQRGKSIHIFSRIVAVANVLDNLMRDAHDQKRPMVAALHDLIMNPRFEGWFDPVVVRAIARRIPAYPVGSQVTLSDGVRAAVVMPNLAQPCSPMVRLLEGERDAEGRLPMIDLSQRPDLRVVRCAGAEVAAWWFELPKDPGTVSDEPRP